MKAILEFDLPDDSAEHRLAIDGWKWHRVVTELDNRLRTIVKHGDCEEILASEFRKILHEELEEAGLSLEES